MVLDLPISAEDGPNTLPDISGSKVIWLLERGLPFPHWFDTFFARCNAELKVLKTDRNLVGVDPVSLGATVFILETYDPEIVDAWCVAWEPHGRFLATCSSDKTARLWAPSAAAGGAWVTVAELEGVHTRTVRHVSWSPCGTFISGHHHYGRPSWRGESQT